MSRPALCQLWINARWCQTSYGEIRRSRVQGIAPFGEDIALLTYILEGQNSPHSTENGKLELAGEARRPEVYASCKATLNSELHLRSKTLEFSWLDEVQSAYIHLQASWASASPVHITKNFLFSMTNVRNFGSYSITGIGHELFIVVHIIGCDSFMTRSSCQQRAAALWKLDPSTLSCISMS